jgi:hypothetical protein
MPKLQLDDNERTRKIYEELPWYPKPPLINFPDFDYLISSEHSGLRYRMLPAWLIESWWTFIGLKSFYKQLPHNIEKLLRENEVNGPVNGLIHVGTCALRDDPNNSCPIERAVSLILAMYDLYEDIMSGNFEPDAHQGQVLEMGHYLNLFSTSFVIENGKPRIFKSANISQITVIIDGKFYSLSTEGARSKTGFNQLKRSLIEIVERARQSGAQDPNSSPGLLTCANEIAQRWMFSKLQKRDVNVKSLQALRHSFVTLCLDLNSNPKSAAEAAFAAQSLNCSNRWFHASYQIVVFGNGSACVLSHPGAYIPGDTAARAAHEMQVRALKYREAPEIAGKPVDLPRARELNWEIDRELIDQALKDTKPILDKQQATFEIPGVGKNYFAKYGLPAVPMFVIALQMTIKRLTGKISVIRQLLTMSKYRCMPFTDAIVTTKEVVDFVNYVEGGDAQPERAIVLLRQAANSQIQECRRVRKYIPFPLVFDLFMRWGQTSNKVSQRLKSYFIIRIIGIAYLAGLFKFAPRDVLISHPRIYPSFTIVGRPGVRIPYTEDFGLHYQIYDENIITTIMPSLNWEAPNVTFMATLEESLRQIQSIISHTQQAHINVDNARETMASPIG